MRKKKFALNSVSSLGYRLSLIICGLILPNLIIRTYGTEVNGLVNSINQFLGVICLSEFGLTAVIQSSLYEPLSKDDNIRIGQIVYSSDRFFRKISLVLLGYVGILCFILPYIVKSKYRFNYFYIITLLLIISINYFSKYLIAFTNSQLLCADQKAYIYLFFDTISIIVSTLICYIEMLLGYGIHIVELTTAGIFLIKPIFIGLYIRKKYRINRKERYSEEPIVQKWNGIAQHLAYFAFTNTDIIVLTLFSSLINVSIYSVYAMVLNGLKALSSMFEEGIRSMLGELWAIGDKDTLNNYFSLYEWFMFSLSTFLYGCAISLMVPFLKVYTRNISDANYILPTFSLIITIAFLVQNLRGPYHTLIQSVGLYKETQASYVVTALVNFMVSVLLVYRFGLIGVAIGTLIGASIEIIWQSLFLYRKVLNKTYIELVKLFLVHGFSFVIAIYICKFFDFTEYSYISWIKLAIPTSFVWISIIFFISFFFYKKQIKLLRTIMFNYRN